MVEALHVAELFGHVDELRTTLRIEGQEDGALTVLSFSGAESISTPFAYDIVVGSSAETAAGLDDALGREAELAIERAGDDASAHVIRGIVEEVFPGGVAVGKKQRETHLRIVPRLAELRHVQRSRVYQNVTVVDIARELFAFWRIDLEARLHPEPLKREYCTQVNETDMTFLSRILAEEGIHFHFEYADDKTVVVLVNDPRGYEPIDGDEVLPYRDADGALTVEHVKSIRRERRVRTGSVAYRDYNFIKPQREMTARDETDSPNAPGTHTGREIYEYPGSYVDPDEQSAGISEDIQMPTLSGAARAKLRLEEQRSRALTFSGTTNSLRMRVGRRFEINDHPDEAFNRKYVITELSLGGASAGPVQLQRGDRTPGSAVSLSFVAVPAETPIRPAVRPKPRAHLRIARVVGPKSDEPYVDEFGRIKIQFAWDREGQLDEKSSCWVRMATPVAHHGQGSYTAHRVGAEVLVDFVDGDVDRPVVISALFNGDNRQPQALPSDATRAVLYRGLSVPGNKGKNEISCEDRAGKEEIFLHAQKDLNERILHNHSETIGANQSSSVGANQSVSVGSNQTISVGANRTVSVKGDENIDIVNSRHEKVGDGESVTVTGGRSHTVASKDDALTVEAGNRSVKVSAKHSLTADAKEETIATTIDVNAGTSIKIHHQDDATMELKAGEASLGTTKKIVLSNPSGTITLEGGKVQIAAADELVLSSGGAKISLKKDGTLSLQGSKEVGLVSGGSSVKLEPAQAVVNGSAVNVTASGMMEISGAMVKIN